MKLKKFGLKNKVMIIAEIGNNHEGSFKLAKKLIDKAARAGVDAVKFQTFKTEEYTNDKDKLRYKRLKKFELSKEDFYKLSKFAKSKKETKPKLCNKKSAILLPYVPKKFLTFILLPPYINEGSSGV